MGADQTTRWGPTVGRAALQFGDTSFRPIAPATIRPTQAKRAGEAARDHRAARGDLAHLRRSRRLRDVGEPQPRGEVADEVAYENRLFGHDAIWWWWWWWWWC